MLSDGHIFECETKIDTLNDDQFFCQTDREMRLYYSKEQQQVTRFE